MGQPNNQEKVPAIIACEIKISVTPSYFEDLRELVDKIREICAGDEYKLEVNFTGEFGKL